jgi:hypothetical protein
VTQPAGTASTYKFNPTGVGSGIIREDLEDYVYKISPLETPVMQAIGRKGKFLNTYHEWPIVELAAANPDNAKIEGDDAVNDNPDLGLRRGNYTQLLNKTAQVSTTADAVRGAGGIQTMSKQVMYKLQEAKRDMEARTAGSGSKIAVAGSDTVARQTASIAAFIMTNTDRGATGANGTLSGGTNGFPSGAETPGTGRALTETMLKNVVQLAWTQGGNPKFAFVSGKQKTVISAFTGNATRFKRAEDRRLIAAIDVYESDFGQLQIVPDRFQDITRVLVIDPGYAELGYLQPMNNTPLARNGNATRRLIACEWGVIVGNEKAHGMVADLT